MLLFTHNFGLTCLYTTVVNQTNFVAWSVCVCVCVRSMYGNMYLIEHMGKMMWGRKHK